MQNAIDKTAARVQGAIVVDAIERIARAVTLGDVVRLDSDNGAAGLWYAVGRMLALSYLCRDL